MIGLSILLALAVYIWLAKWLAGQVASKKAKILIIAAFVLIPTWDIVPDWLYLEHFCSTQAGITVLRQAQNIEGFRDSANLGIVDSALKTFGYRFVEGKDARYVLDINGNVVKQELNSVSSRYEIRSQLNSPLPLTLYMNEWFIVDMKNDEILATMRAFYSFGGWVKKLMSPVLGHGPRCDSVVNFETFYSKTLIPTANLSK